MDITRQLVKEWVDTGYEIEFRYKGKDYSITYFVSEGKEYISFCEFYKEPIDVETADELCDIQLDGKTLLEVLQEVGYDNISY